jgi:YfiH family protein
VAFEYAPWPLPASVQAGWTTRRSGVSSAPFNGFNVAYHVGDAPSSVDINRALLWQQLQQTPQIAWLNQTHSTHVVQASHASTKEPSDASVTMQKGIACCVMTADCLPVFFWTKKGDQVAVAHAGWRGLANGILLNTLQQFPNAADVVCGLGPCIGPTAFEVGSDVKRTFADWPNSQNCFTATEKPEKFLADLPRLAEQQLRLLGVAHVYRSDICTVSYPTDYFSFRRDGETGRMANLIWKID